MKTMLMTISLFLSLFHATARPPVLKTNYFTVNVTNTITSTNFVNKTNITTLNQTNTVTLTQTNVLTFDITNFFNFNFTNFFNSTNCIGNTNLVTEPNEIVLSNNVVSSFDAYDKSDGPNPFYSYLYSSYDQNFEMSVYMLNWNNLAKTNVLVLQNNDSLGDGGFTIVNTNRLVLLRQLNGTAVFINEYQLNFNGDSLPTSITPLGSFTFGDTTNRNPRLFRTSKDGVVAIAYRYAQIAFDIAYRSPSGQWSTNRYTYDPNLGGIPSQRFAIQELNGKIYVFIPRDSSHLIMLLRLQEQSNGTLAFVDFDPQFVNGNGFGCNFCPGFDPNWPYVDGILAPHGEFPDVRIAKDDYNNRLILSYQNASFLNTCGHSAAYAVFASVFEDTNGVAKKSFVALTPLPEERVWTYIPMNIEPDGISFLYTVIDPNDCGASDQYWNYWRKSKFNYANNTFDTPILLTTNALFNATSAAGNLPYFIFRDDKNLTHIKRVY